VTVVVGHQGHTAILFDHTPQRSWNDRTRPLQARR